MVTDKQKANLVSLKDRATSERREIARLGGIARGQSRRLNSALTRILSLPVTKAEERNVKNTLNIPSSDKTRITHWEVVAMKLIEKARRGDVKAIRVLAEITGDLDKQVQMDVTSGGNALDIFAGLTERQVNNIIERLARDE